jgi:hypothetical protein
MSAPYRYDGVLHLYNPKFGTFNGKSSGSFELDEYGPYWGHKVPEKLVTWLNAKGVDKENKKEDASTEKSDGKSKSKSLKEVQIAYMTVSPDIYRFTSMNRH